WVHAVAAYGEPALPRGFSHFPYADPAAPKGGTMVLDNPDRRSSFDKFNYFTLRGQAPAGLNLYMFETLATRGADEPMTMYGLLAEEIRVEPDLSAI
ncbi:MAG TPA: ABC transporter substrate-binding protein, partial [Rubrivivax sp.]|nr:ABC transporter substrate-binding protein [Rubrivivax sp.]